MGPSRSLTKHAAPVEQLATSTGATRAIEVEEYSRDTDPINEDPNLKEQRIIRLHKALHQPARPRRLPAVDRHAERSIVWQTGHKRSQDRQVAQVALGQEIGRRVEDGWAVEVGGFWLRQYVEWRIQ